MSTHTHTHTPAQTPPHAYARLTPRQHAGIFFSQLRLGLVLYLRVRSAVFWVFAFPILLLLGLGTIFSGKVDTGPHLVWARAAAADANDARLATALAERGITLDIVPPAEAEARWQLGKTPALLEGQAGRYRLRTNTYLASQAGQADALVQQAFLVAQVRARGAAEPDRIAVVASSPGGHHGGPYAAFLLPGLLALNLLTMGIFATGTVDVTMRAKGGYKRLATTPLPKGIYLGAQLCVRLIMLLASAATLMLVGYLVFGIRNQGSYAAMFGLMMLGAACFVSLGYLLASTVRSVETYQGVGNLVFLPLMMLSGLYYSLDAAPDWLQRGVDLLPLAPLLKALRAVFNDGATLASQGSGMLVVGAWTLVLFVLAVRRFRWV